MQNDFTGVTAGQWLIWEETMDASGVTSFYQTGNFLATSVGKGPSGGVLLGGGNPPQVQYSKM